MHERRGSSQRHTVDECLGGRGAAGDIDVHGHDAIAATHHGVGVVVVAAAVGTAAHRQDVARLRHLVVDLAEGRGHLVGQRACASEGGFGMRARGAAAGWLAERGGWQAKRRSSLTAQRTCREEAPDGRGFGTAVVVAHRRRSSRLPDEGRRGRRCRSGPCHIEGPLRASSPLRIMRDRRSSARGKTCAPSSPTCRSQLARTQCPGSREKKPSYPYPARPSC